MFTILFTKIQSKFQPTKCPRDTTRRAQATGAARKLCRGRVFVVVHVHSDSRVSLPAVVVLRIRVLNSHAGVISSAVPPIPLSASSHARSRLTSVASTLLVLVVVVVDNRRRNTRDATVQTRCLERVVIGCAQRAVSDDGVISPAAPTRCVPQTRWRGDRRPRCRYRRRRRTFSALG